MRIGKENWKEKLIDFEKKHPFIPFLGTAGVLLVVAVLIFGGYFIKKSIMYNEEPVEFADKEFKKAIQKELKKENIYQQDLDSITVLKIDGNKNIENAGDITTCRNVTELEITNCSITDLSFVGELEHIQSINLKGNNIVSLDGLQKATTLKEVILDNNYISDLEVLGQMEQLESLSLANNNISVLPDNLCNMDNLLYLNLSGNRLVDIAGLNGLINLIKLDISANKLSKRIYMNNMPKLQNLNLSNNAFVEMDTLGELPQLEELDISDNYLSDLAFLEQYPRLKEIDLSYNEFGSLDGILKCNELEYLNIQGTKITDVTYLQELEYFNSIYVDDNFDREQLIFMADSFRNCDNKTKEFLLKYRYNLS